MDVSLEELDNLKKTRMNHLQFFCNNECIELVNVNGQLLRKKK
jgi:hypothetical protein